MAEVSAAQVQAVIRTFAEEFIVDVPAIHPNNQYLIPLSEFESYARNLTIGEATVIAQAVGDPHI